MSVEKTLRTEAAKRILVLDGAMGAFYNSSCCRSVEEQTAL